MNTDKEKILKFIGDEPDNASWDELVRKLLLSRILTDSKESNNDNSVKDIVEIAKLSLEEKKINNEHEIKRSEIEFKKQETKGISPGYAAIFAGILGFVASSLAAYIQANSNIQLENLKFQTDLIKKGIEPEDKDRRIELLQFYISAGLIKDQEIINNLNKLIKEKKIPQASSFINSYEGRKDLGNTNSGDGYLFRGRGYLQLTGRANYEKYRAKIGIDIVNNPDLVAEPKNAAKILVLYFNQHMSSIEKSLNDGDFKTPRRKVVGGLNGAEKIAERTKVYLKVLETTGNQSTTINVPGVTNPKWLTVDVPAILNELQAAGINEPIIKAYILATAEHDTLEGTVMTEKMTP